MIKEQELLCGWQNILSAHSATISQFLISCQSICIEYDKSKQSEKDNSFNIFTIISDLYYRENFHSDLIRYFLSPMERHGEGSLFLTSFITMLNKLGRTINPQDYFDASVIREEGKIDILIKSEINKKAIIIENKINNASDMPRQLPRYYDYLYPNYSIDAIVYLPLEKSKKPDMSDWTEKDKSNVCPLLEIIPAYDKSDKKNIVDSWLMPAIKDVTNANVLSILNQYISLIKILNSNIMDIVILEKFYQELLQKDNLKAAQSIRNMMNELPNYLALRIQDKFGACCHPFSKLWIYGNHDAVFEGAVIDNIYLKMDIWCYEFGYDVLFWSPEDKNTSENDFNYLINNIKSLDGFVKKEGTKNQIIRQFRFEEEGCLFSFIKALLSELTNKETKIEIKSINQYNINELLLTAKQVSGAELSSFPKLDKLWNQITSRLGEDSYFSNSMEFFITPSKALIIKSRLSDFVIDTTIIEGDCVICNSGGLKNDGHLNEFINECIGMPLMIYNVDGVFMFKTDSLGRTISTIENLHSAKNIGRGGHSSFDKITFAKDGKTTDVGGHIIANNVNGPSEAINIVPMDTSFNNSGDWKSMEKMIQDAFYYKNEVLVKKELFYPGDSKRPNKIKVNILIDGEESNYSFDLP